MNTLEDCLLPCSDILNDFMHVIIVPLVINKSGDLTNKDNYRPISLSTIISKVFEQIILWKYEYIFSLNEQENQFAFKSKHSTRLCVYILKQIIFNYTKNNTSAYACFIW